MEEKVYILTMLVANKPSVTARITGLFSGRGYNIQSICGAPTHNPEISRITIKTQASPKQYDEIMKQVSRLIDVIKLRDMTDDDAVKREMALISVGVTPENRTELIQTVDIFNAKVVSAGVDSYIIEVTGTEKKNRCHGQYPSPHGNKKIDPFRYPGIVPGTGRRPSGTERSRLREAQPILLLSGCPTDVLTVTAIPGYLFSSFLSLFKRGFRYNLTA